MITVGVDVGASKKGFHVVANLDGNFLDKFHSQDADEVVSWISNHAPKVIGIDAPCMFSLEGRSREAERSLVKNGIKCFYTPTRELAQKSLFYDWVFNGELLFQKLNLPIFMGKKIQSPCVIETFPHGVYLSYWHDRPSDTPKISKSMARRITLERKAVYKTCELSNIDFIDAALCAISADYFFQDRYIAFGSYNEGYIVLPDQSQNYD